jgi:enoyl-CoA hydratase/carnithine racemase
VSVREIVLDDRGMNLLSSSMLTWIDGQVRDDAALLVLRSGRPHIFAAGADMAEMQRFTAADAARFARQGQELFEKIEALPCITVAIIDGDCFGGALDLVLAFDLRFATPRSRFSHPGARLGIVTGFGGTSRWRRMLEPPAARALFLGNAVLRSDEALAAGVIDRIGETFCDELARLEALDPPTTRLVKELSRHAGALSQQNFVVLAERLADILVRCRSSESTSPGPTSAPAAP